LRVRKEYPEVGITGALYRMLRFTYMPDPKAWADRHEKHLLNHDENGE
jgi:hypothetical protein